MGKAERPRPSRRVLSVVVPCFNEQEVLPLTYQQLVETLEMQPDLDLEILFVDDGSSDNTPAILCRLADIDDRVVVVTLTRNFGHQAAVTAGLQHASGDAVVVIDADLQDPPHVIPDMIEKWRAGYNVVYGIRTKRQETWAKRVLYSTFYRVLQTLAHIEIPVDSGDFALIDRQAVELLNSLPERVRFVRGLRAWIGLRQIGLPYERPYRAAGSSKYSVFALIKLGLDGIFSLSTRPLSLVFLLGVISAAGSGLAFIFYLGWRLYGGVIFGMSPGEAPGFTSIVLLFLLLGGIQLICIGIIGEYVGRIYEEAKGRPTYLSKKVKRSRKRTRPKKRTRLKS